MSDIKAVNRELLAKAYHTIIADLEGPRVAGINKPISEGKIYTIRDPYYFLAPEEIVKHLSLRLHIPSQKAVNVLDELKRLGFLVELPDNFEQTSSNRLRSLHMDMLVRSAFIRTIWTGLRYIISPRFIIYRMEVPSQKDRKYMPTLNNPDPINTNLLTSIRLFFNDVTDVVKDYIGIMKDYIKKCLNSKGLDAFQACALASMLRSSAKLHVLTAPTGVGKTEVFLLYTLARLMRAINMGKRELAVFVYPRRQLQLDQAERILKLLYIAEEHGYKFHFGIRDGDTPKVSDIREEKVKSGDIFRGLRCPRCGGRLCYNIKESGLDDVCCLKCNKEFDYVLSTRRSLGQQKLEILVTNMWALEIRLIDSSVNDVNVNTFRNVGVIVIDEAHEWLGIKGGMVANLIRLLRQQNQTEEPVVIVSSATMPEPMAFATKLTGIPEKNAKRHDFNIIYEELPRLVYPVKLSGERLVIMALFNINPRYSWSTYCQLWAVLVTYLSYAYRNRPIKPQSLLFINNIKELHRTYQGFIETVTLGEPRDHIIGPKEKGKPLDSIDPYAYWHYACLDLRKELLNLFQRGGKLDELVDKTSMIYSGSSQEDRIRIFESLKSGRGTISTVFSTSSLELGVDYKGVTFILNVGMESPLIIAQRIGRGGRELSSSLRSVLGVILTRNLPSENALIHSPDIGEKLSPVLRKGEALPVAYDNPQIMRRALLIKAFTKLAKSGRHTYASRRSLKTVGDAQQLILDIIDAIKEEMKDE